MEPVKVRKRTRAGSSDDFKRRYEPLDSPSGSLIWDWQEVPGNTDIRFIWTVLDCDGNPIMFEEAKRIVFAAFEAGKQSGLNIQSYVDEGEDEDELDET